MIRIGVDVGGTNTDAVVMDNESLLGGVKRPTTADIIGGVRNAIKAALDKTGTEPDKIDAIMVGTTHFVNALVERKALSATGVIRLCLPSGGSLKPFAAWPLDLVTAVSGQSELVKGGYEMDGREISQLDRVELMSAVRDLTVSGCTEIALSTVFATIRNEMELKAAEIIAEEFPDITVTCSSDIGRIGLLERENAAIINASLRPLANNVVTSFASLTSELGLECPLFFTRNDGTLIEAEEVKRLPVLTFACGPTNSMRGAAFLSGLQNALVVDIGGTTTDVGEIIGGFPRLAGTSVAVADVQTNFSMPDVISVGLGGGSIVRLGAKPSIGPDSVGHQLLQEGKVFGGQTLTTSDVAVAAGRADIGTVSPPELEELEDLLGLVDEIVSDAVARSRTSSETVPVLAVGGGSILMPNEVDGLEVIRPENYGLANAVGAAIAQVSGEATKIVTLEGDLSRDQAIAMVEKEAREIAVGRGAQPDTITVLSKSDVPLAYLPGENLSISVTVVGDLSLEDKQ